MLAPLHPTRWILGHGMNRCMFCQLRDRVNGSWPYRGDDTRNDRLGGMLRFGMGFSKDGDRTVDTRPCVRVHSLRCQVVLNKWSGGPKEDKPHPDWMSTQFEAPARTFAGDQGDWKMVWHPRSRPNTVTVSTRNVRPTICPSDRAELQSKVDTILSY